MLDSEGKLCLMSDQSWFVLLLSNKGANLFNKDLYSAVDSVCGSMDCVRLAAIAPIPILIIDRHLPDLRIQIERTLVSVSRFGLRAVIAEIPITVSTFGEGSWQRLGLAAPDFGSLLKALVTLDASETWIDARVASLLLSDSGVSGEIVDNRSFLCYHGGAEV